MEVLACANAEKSNVTKDLTLRRIMNTEDMREDHRRIKIFFPKKTLSKRVDKVTYVEDGTIKEATTPNNIVHQIQKGPILKYTSTLNTPLVNHEVHNDLGNYAEINFQGAGQGNTGRAEPYWTCVSTPMIDFMKENDFQSEFTCAISQRIITLTLIAFVDDAELFIMDKSNSSNAIMNKAELSINVWREVLEVTGGAMR